MNRFRWPLALAVLYVLLVIVVVTEDLHLRLHGLVMLLMATGIVGWAIWLWVDEEALEDQQYVESVMRGSGDCLVCSGKAQVGELDRFSVLGLCRPHLREWAEAHGVWRDE